MSARRTHFSLTLSGNTNGTIIVIVGLPDAAAKEPRDRASTAQANSGFNRLLRASRC